MDLGENMRIGWLLFCAMACLLGCSAAQYACPVIDLADKTCENVIIKYDDVDGGEGASKVVKKEDLIEALHNMEQDSGTSE